MPYYITYYKGLYSISIDTCNGSNSIDNPNSNSIAIVILATRATAAAAAAAAAAGAAGGQQQQQQQQQQQYADAGARYFQRCCWWSKPEEWMARWRPGSKHYIWGGVEEGSTDSIGVGRRRNRSLRLVKTGHEAFERKTLIWFMSIISFHQPHRHQTWHRGRRHATASSCPRPQSPQLRFNADYNKESATGKMMRTTLH